MSDIRDPLEAERLEVEAPDALHSRREFLQHTAEAAGLTASLGLILMMENRSFDHYLGLLPGTDGRQAGLQFTDKHGVTHATHRLADFFQSCGFLDPDHSWDGGRTELDGGRMDGFLKSASDAFSIGYYGPTDRPFTPHIAQTFTAFDRFFCSLLDPTYPNREYMHAMYRHPSSLGFRSRGPRW